jgi:hypothetical protein
LLFVTNIDRICDHFRTRSLKELTSFKVANCRLAMYSEAIFVALAEVTKDTDRFDVKIGYRFLLIEHYLSWQHGASTLIEYRIRNKANEEAI